MDSTKPASRSTRRCLDTIGCGMPSCRSISPTDCCDETRRLNIARRFGSAMISNTDSILLVYSAEHIRVKVYKGRGPSQRFQSACGDAPSDAFLAGAIQSAARSGRRGSVFGPAEFGEGAAETRERQAHDVEVTAFDAGNEAAGVALDGIGARYVVGLAGGEVVSDFIGGERGEVYVGDFDARAALGVGETDESYTGDHGVGAPGKFFKHLAGILAGARLPEKAALQSHLSVRGNDNSRANSASGDELGFGAGQPLHKLVGGFTGEGCFVDRRREHDEGKARVAENLGAACRSGSENQLHSRVIRERILQRERGYSLCFGPVGDADDLGPTLFQMTTDSWYSPKTRRSASEISPTVA